MTMASMGDGAASSMLEKTRKDAIATAEGEAAIGASEKLLLKPEEGIALIDKEHASEIDVSPTD
mgnify:CR=1 FL=1|jgi:hypothetical protein